MSVSSHWLQHSFFHPLPEGRCILILSSCDFAHFPFPQTLASSPGVVASEIKLDTLKKLSPPLSIYSFCRAQYKRVILTPTSQLYFWGHSLKVIYIQLVIKYKKLYTPHVCENLTCPTDEHHVRMVGVERCQLEVELVWVWRRQGPSDPPAPHLETRRAHVQQVRNRRHTLAASFSIFPLFIHLRLNRRRLCRYHTLFQFCWAAADWNFRLAVDIS